MESSDILAIFVKAIISVRLRHIFKNMKTKILSEAQDLSFEVVMKVRACTTDYKPTTYRLRKTGWFNACLYLEYFSNESNITQKFKKCFWESNRFKEIESKPCVKCFIDLILINLGKKLANETELIFKMFSCFDSYFELFNSAIYLHKHSSLFYLFTELCHFQHLPHCKQNDILSLVLTISKQSFTSVQAKANKKSKLTLLSLDDESNEVEHKVRCYEKAENPHKRKIQDDDFDKKDSIKSYKDLMQELLSSKHFRINPVASYVYIVDGNSIPRHPQRLGEIQWSWLNEEKWRLHTFSRYPHSAAKSAILLAADGFAYMGTGRDYDDTVICYFCIVVKKSWQPMDDVSEVHKQLKPCCSMVTKINCTNVPMETHRDSSFFDSFYKQPNKNQTNRPHVNDSHDIEDDGGFFESSVSGAHRDSVSSTAWNQGASNNIPQLNATSFNPRPDTVVSSSAQNSHATVTQAVSSPSMVTISSSSTLASDSVTSVASARPATNVTLSATPEPLSSLPTALAAQPSANRLAAASMAQTISNSSQVSSAAASNTVLQTSLNAGQNTVKGNASGPTYSELGIVTERPKRFEYALLAKRMETFLSWPRDHHLRPKELAEAGFYYAGYGDCARCFYCGGGLRNWEDEDDVWVEHARWFPKCAYIRQQMGQVFVDTVQELNKIKDHISFTSVTDEIGHAASAFQLDSKENPLKRDPAVKTIIDMGFPLAEVIAVAEALKEDGNMLSSDKIYNKLVAAKIKKNQNNVNMTDIDADGAENEAALAAKLEKIRTLKEQNNQLRQQTVCKICMDKDVAVVFLPCGHFVSCTDCAAAMKDCPVCRNHVKGIVRAFMG